MSNDTWMDRLASGQLHPDDIPPSVDMNAGTFGSAGSARYGRQFTNRRDEVLRSIREEWIAGTKFPKLTAEQQQKKRRAALRPKALRNRFLWNAEGTVDAPLTNRGVDNRQKDSGVFALHREAEYFGCGEDRAEIVVYVKWNNWRELEARFEAARKEAENARFGKEETTANIVDDWIVDGSGFRLGGKTGPIVRYKMQRDGVDLGVMRVETFEGSLPNVKVIFGSMALMVHGFEKLWTDTLEQIADWDGVVDHAVVSRVDYCCDLPGHDVAEFVERFMARYWVSRARGWRPRGCIKNEFGDFTPADGVEPTGICDGAAECSGDLISINGTGFNLTSFEIGSGIRLICYDKMLETQHQEAKREVVKAVRWGGVLPECATRVEFQVRRTYLKQFGVTSPECWIKKRAGVLCYLAESWFRFTEQAPDVRNGHQDRTEMWSLWAKVAKSLVIAAGGETKTKRTLAVQPEFKALKRQQLGITATLFACTVFDESRHDETNIVQEITRFTAEQMVRQASQFDAKKLLRKLVRKRLLFRAANPLGDQDEKPDAKRAHLRDAG